MMDVLLFNLAEVLNEKGENQHYLVPQMIVPPMGLLYIGQILSENGFSVKIYDQGVTGAKNSEIMEYVKKLNPKIVGFSMMVDNFWTTLDLYDKIKRWNPNIITIAGNYYGTFFPEKLMKEIDIDFCVRGEGEYSFLKVVENILEKKHDLGNIKGIAYRENNLIKSKPIPEPIQNLDQIPIPDRNLIDFQYGADGRATAVITSRGCPFNCRFCNNMLVMGKRWRPRSAENVVEEVKLLKDQGYKYIFFIDDNLTLSKKRTYQICAQIKRNQLDDLIFHGDCRVDNVNLTLMRALVSANFKQMLFGIESASQRILDYYRKGITVSQAEQAIKTAKKSRLELIFGSFVFGAPDETYSEALRTLKFALKLKLHYTVLQILYVLPVSQIYQELVTKKLYTPREDDWKKVLRVSDICPRAIPTEKLLRIIDEGFVQLFNRRGILKYLMDSITNTYYIDNVVKSVRGFKRGI